MKIKNFLTNKKLSKVILKIIYILLAIGIIYNVIFIASAAITGKNNIKLGGVNFFIIQDDSMKKTLHNNDFIITKSVKAKDLGENQIVATYIGNTVRIHRIDKIISNNGDVRYITKGDNNYYQDNEELAIEKIEGKLILKIPFIGAFLQLFETKVATVGIIIFLILKYQYNKDKRKNRIIRKNKKQGRYIK